MSQNTSLLLANLGAIVVTSLLYGETIHLWASRFVRFDVKSSGAFVTIFIASVYSLLNVNHPPPIGAPRERTRTNWKLLLSSTLLFTLITTVCDFFLFYLLETDARLLEIKDWILCTVRSFDGFVHSRDTPGSVAFFSNAGEPKNVAHGMISFLEILLADSILVGLSIFPSLLSVSILIITFPKDLPGVCHLGPQTVNHNISHHLLGGSCWSVLFYLLEGIIYSQPTVCASILTSKISKTNAMLVDGKLAAYSLPINIWTTPTYGLTAT